MSALVDQALAALDRDPGAIREAASDLTSTARPVADHGVQVTRTWRTVDPYYAAPEAPLLVAALDPVAADSDVVSQRLQKAGTLLGRYADQIEPLLAQIKQVLSIVGPLEPAAAAAQEQRLNGLLLQLSELDLDCAHALRALTGKSPFDPVPGQVKVGDRTTKNGSEITIGVVKIGQSFALVETRFSNGKVMFTLTDGGKLAGTVGLGEKEWGGRAGLTGKLELAPGVSFENGSSWIVPADQADAFRATFEQYAYRHEAAFSADEGAVWGAAVADYTDPLPPLRPPDAVASNFEVPVELKATLDASPPGPLDLTAAGAAGLTAKWSDIRNIDGSSVHSFGGEGSYGGDAKVYSDDGSPAGSGNADSKHVAGGTAAVTRDPNGVITKVVLTQTQDGSQGLGDKVGTSPSDQLEGGKASISAGQKTSTVDVTTTSLAVDDRNRAIVEQWVAQHDGDPGTALGSSATFYPDTAAPDDPFQNVLHTDAQVSKVHYENVTDKTAFGAQASLGVTLGAEVTGETSSGHATGGTYLDAPGIDGRRVAKPIPGVGG